MILSFNEWVMHRMNEDLEPDFMDDPNESVYTTDKLPRKWKKNEEGRIKRKFRFNNYDELMTFLQDVNDDFTNRAFYPSIMIEDSKIVVDIGRSIELNKNAILIAKDLDKRYKEYNLDNIDAGSEMDPSSDFITIGDKKLK